MFGNREPLIDTASRRALEGMDAGRQIARRASDATVGYIRHEPVRSVLAAAAAGAMVYALVRALRGRDRH